MAGYTGSKDDLLKRLRRVEGLGPADPFKRAVRHRSSLQKRRVASAMRLDALLELLGPGWLDLFGTVSYGKAAVAVLERYANPLALRKLGRARLAKLLIRASRGQWREAKADEMLERAKAMPGFVEFKSYRFDDGERVSVIQFATRADHDAWSRDVEHRLAQQAGRDFFYTEYRITVASVDRERAWPR